MSYVPERIYRRMEFSLKLEYLAAIFTCEISSAVGFFQSAMAMHSTGEGELLPRCFSR